MQSIENKSILIKKPETTLTSEYIESELKKAGYKNPLRWAIVEVKSDCLKVDFCVC